MTKAEILYIINQKKNEKEKYEIYSLVNLIKYIVLFIIFFSLTVIAGFASLYFNFKYNNFETLWLSWLCFIFAGIIFIFGLFAIIFIGVKKSRAPYAIAKLAEEIEEYEKKLSDKQADTSIKNKSLNDKIDSLEVILKSKELLDKGAITQEEFDEIKTKTLNNISK